MTEKQEILNICDKLKKQGFITEIKENRYSIQFLIRCDDDYEEDSYIVRNKIKSKFENKGYTVQIRGTYWLEVIYVNIDERINDCFE